MSRQINGDHMDETINGAGASIFRVRSGVRMPEPNEVYPFGRMDVGQMFLIPKDFKVTKIRCAASVYAKNHGGRPQFKIRRTGPDQYGCWRVK